MMRFSSPSWTFSRSWRRFPSPGKRKARTWRRESRTSKLDVCSARSVPQLRISPVLARSSFSVALRCARNLPLLILRSRVFLWGFFRQGVDPGVCCWRERTTPCIHGCCGWTRFLHWASRCWRLSVRWRRWLMACIARRPMWNWRYFCALISADAFRSAVLVSFCLKRFLAGLGASGRMPIRQSCKFVNCSFGDWRTDYQF